MRTNYSAVLLRAFLCLAILSAICLRAESQTSSTASGLAQARVTQARITQAIDEKNLIVLKGNVHPLARAEFDQGAVSDAQPLHRMLLLLQRSPAQEAALQSLLDSQQDKSSPSYHQWLTPAQFGQQFGPADADMQAVTSWLQSHGFQVTNVTAGRTLIEFSGTAAQVRNAFHTEMHTYAVNGETHIANATDPQIPAAMAAVIGGIVSLNDFRKKPMYHLAGRANHQAATGLASSAHPEYTFDCVDFLTGVFGAFAGQSPTCRGLGPYDFATVYNVLPLWNAVPAIDGTGQTIAIVGRTNIDLQDVTDFRNLFGLPSNPPQVILDGPDPGPVKGDETEADLDVEWSGAVAKGATIDLVASQSTETTDGVDLSALYIVDRNLAPIMSESYGQCEFNMGTAGNLFYQKLWQQAAAQGISVFVSSGDSGSAACDLELDQGLPPPQPAQFGLAVNGIASTPFNVAVGGTDFNDYFTASTYWNQTSDPVTQESAKSYIPETTWNPSCTNAFFEDPRFRLTPNAESNCNNSYETGIVGLVLAIGAGGGASNCTSASGSNVSRCAGGYAKPTWQAAPGVPSDGARDLPDVSLFSSSGLFGSFYMMCQSDLVGGTPCGLGNFVGIGGTSASTPSFAGLLAIVNQQTGGRQGNPNYVLYGLAAKQSATNCNSSAGPASSCIFNDVTSGTIAVACVTGSPNCITSNPADQVGILSGFSTGAGYDLATGLGSANASNLVKGWSSVNRNSSTTVLTLNGGNAVSITHGTSLNVAISVGPSSPQPTGAAALIATQGNQTFGIDSFALSDGSFSGTTNLLPGGSSYSVRAHYEGNGNYAGSDSTPTTVTVNPEASETNVYLDTLDTTTGLVTAKNATTFPYGSIYLLRADVANSSGTSCFSATNGSLSYGCPTGTISFTVDGTSLGSEPAPLNSQGYTENQTIQLTTGSHDLTGNYNGDNSFLASSGKDSVTVTPAPTVLGGGANFPLPIGPYTYNLFVRSANIGNFPAPPTGTFTISDDGNQLLSTLGQPGTGVIEPGPGSPYVWVTFGGNLDFTLPGPSGPHMLTLNYSGDSNYQASTSGPFPVTEVYTTTLQLTPSAPAISAGQPLTVTARIIPGQNASAPPTGSVTFSVYGSAIGSIAVSNGQAQITTSSLSPGTVQITATYSGDSNYLNSTATMLETVSFVSTTTSISPSSSSIAQGASVTFTARISPSPAGGAPVTGSVFFAANGIELGNEVVSNSQAQVTTSFSTLGTIQVKASYSGDANYSPSAGTVTETVNAPPDFSFTVAAGQGSQTVSAGQTATFSNVITINAMNGFTGSVSATCTLPAQATTCSVNPSTIAAGQSASVVVTTTARGLFLPPLANWRQISWPRLLPLFLLAVLLCLFLMRFARTKKQRLVAAMPLAGVVLFLVLQAVGCGGGGYSAPPPPPPTTGTLAGAYTITVTGTSTNPNATHSAALQLTVN